MTGKDRGRVWSTEKLEQLHQMLQQNLTPEVIAARLNLDQRQVYQKISKLGLSNRFKWSPESYKVLSSMLHDNAPASAIALELGCSVGTVERQIERKKQRSFKASWGNLTNDLPPEVCAAKLYMQRRGWMVLGPDKNEKFQVGNIKNLDSEQLVKMAKRHGQNN